MTDCAFWEPWLGLPHKLGADPRDGNACCCLKLAEIVLREVGLPVPQIDKKWYALARERCWLELYDEFQLLTQQTSERELWALVPFLTDRSFGIGVVIPNDMLLCVHHRYGVTAVPLDTVRDPTYHVIFQP